MDTRRRDIALRALVILGVLLLVFALVARSTSTAHHLRRACGDLRWDQRPIWLVVDPSAAGSLPAIVDAADVWNASLKSEAFKVDTSTIGVAEFSHAWNASQMGAGLAPVGGVFVVSGTMAVLAEPPTEGADDGLMAARLWWGPSCALGFGILRLPDLSAAPEFVALPMATHALGHVLGLAHSTDVESVMAEHGQLPEVRTDEADPERREIVPRQRVTDDDVDAALEGR
jgi:hypothetical protein